MNAFIVPPQITDLERRLEKLRLVEPGRMKFAEDLVRKGKVKFLSASQMYWVERLTRMADGTSRKSSNKGKKLGDGNQTTQTQTVITKEVTKELDVDAIVERVVAEVDKRKPREVVIEVKRADNTSVKLDGHKHPRFMDLLRAATSRLSNGLVPGIFLSGEASSGKTTGCKMLAEALGLKWHFNGAISFPHEMLGFIDGAGKYHRMPFREAYEHGGVYTFDEVDRSDPVALLAVNPHLAGDTATFPDKQVKRHKDCIIVCTANTWGFGADASYSGATKLDAAFLSRFPVRISWDIDEKLEDKIVKNSEWLVRVRHARARARAVGLKVMIDTRVAQAGAALIEAGYSVDEAAAMTFLANLKPEQRKQVEA